MWGQFDVYWYILEAGGFCPFMPIFIVGGGANVRWGLCPTLAFQGGGQGVLPSPTPFLLFHTSLLPFPTPCFLSSSLALLLSPSNLLLSPTPLSFLSPPFSLNPVRPLHSVTGLFAQKPVPPGTIRTNRFFFTGTINPGRFAQMVKMWNKKFLIENFKLQ